MQGSRIAVVFVLALALLAAGCGGDEEGAATESTTPASPPPTAPILKGRVGPGFTIRLSTESGKAVKTVRAGSYYIEVDDLSEMHNFHLTGPGVDEKTEVEATGTTRWAVKLRKGTYTFVCDPHKSSMHQSFEVTAG